MNAAWPFGASGSLGLLGLSGLWAFQGSGSLALPLGSVSTHASQSSFDLFRCPLLGPLVHLCSVWGLRASEASGLLGPGTGLGSGLALGIMG